MELRVDDQKVQEAMDKSVAETLSNAVGGHAVRSAIDKAVADSLLGNVIAGAVMSAAELIDVQKLSQSLADQLAKSVVKMAHHIIRTAMIEMIMDLKKIPDYDRDKRKAEREKLEAQF